VAGPQGPLLAVLAAVFSRALAQYSALLDNTFLLTSATYGALHAPLASAQIFAGLPGGSIIKFEPLHASRFRHAIEEWPAGAADRECAATPPRAAECADSVGAIAREPLERRSHVRCRRPSDAIAKCSPLLRMG